MEDLITTFYRCNSGELVRFCEVILHNRMISGVDSEDIVQRVVLQAWKKRQKLAVHPNMKGWFLNACRKECCSVMRQNSYQRLHMGWPVPLSEDLSVEEQQDVILRWLNHLHATELLAELTSSLTPLEKSVYEQYYVHEKSAKETADVLELKVNTVNDAARRIRKKATSMRNMTFILLASPIFDQIRSILSEGRP